MSFSSCKEHVFVLCEVWLLISPTVDNWKYENWDLGGQNLLVINHSLKTSCIAVIEKLPYGLRHCFARHNKTFYFILLIPRRMMWELNIVVRLECFFKNHGPCELVHTSCKLDCDGKDCGKERNKQHLDSWYTIVSNIVCLCCYMPQNMHHLKKKNHVFFLWNTGPVIWKILCYAI
jgi:hypothetical protein